MHNLLLFILFVVVVLASESLPERNRVPFGSQTLNPFSGLQLLAANPLLKKLTVTVFLLNLAQNASSVTYLYLKSQPLICSIVVYCFCCVAARFSFSKENYAYLMTAQGVSSILVQALLLRWLVRRMRDRSLLLFGCCCLAVCLPLYGPIWSEWLAFALQPIAALATLISPAVKSALVP